MNKIALTIISKGKGEETYLKRALESIAPFVDGIFITFTTKEFEEAEKIVRTFERSDCPIDISHGDFRWDVTQEAIDWNKKFLTYEPHMKMGDRIFEFDTARNFNLSQVPKDYNWFVWMDADDVFVHGERLHDMVKLGEDNNVEMFYFNYLYQSEFDDKGNVKYRIIEHWRERLARNNGIYKWIAPIHETLIEQRPSQKTELPDCEVIHMNTIESRMDSLTRNLKNLEYSVYRTKGEDPRPIYYLAKAYFDLHTPEYDDRTIPLIHQYLLGDHKSGWPEERQQAWEYLAEIYRRKGNHPQSCSSCLNAFLEPTQPSVSLFVNFSLCWVLMQRWDLALYWIKIASMVPEQKTTLVRSTKDVQGRMLEVLFNANLNLRKIDEAWAAAHKMIEMWPDEKTTQNAYNMVNEIRTQRDLVVDINRLVNHLTRSGEVAKIKPLLASVPKIIEQTPYIQDLYLKNNPPTAWEDTSIVFYCGPGFTWWSPKRLSDPRDAFVGGSEEAVIYMTQELSKLGWKITVYGEPGDEEGDFNGVKWLPYYKFNWLDNFNIVVVWRQLGFFDQKIKAKKTYFWAHDIQNPLEWNNDRISRMTKAFFLSKWHRDNVPELLEGKVIISSNGI